MKITARRGHWSYVDTCGWHLEGTNIVIDRQPEGGFLLMTGFGMGAVDQYLDSSMQFIEATLADYIAMTDRQNCLNCGNIHGDAGESERDGSAWWHGDTAAMPEVGTS